MAATFPPLVEAWRLIAIIILASESIQTRSLNTWWQWWSLKLICSRQNLLRQGAARINEANKEKNLQCLKHPELLTGEEERNLCPEWSHKEELDDRETVNDKRERTRLEQEIVQPQRIKGRKS